MKTLEKLRSLNTVEIDPKELRLIKGGVTDPIYIGGMLGEVEVYARKPFDPSLYIYDIISFKDIDKISGIIAGGKIDIAKVSKGKTLPSDNSDNEDPSTTKPDGQNVPKASKNITTTMQTASSLLGNPNVSLAQKHSTKLNVDNATAEKNMMDASKGLPVHTSSYGTAPGSMVTLSPKLLTGVQTLAQKYKISISEIAGGDHSANSSHYKGFSIDINYVNDDHVDIRNMSKDEILEFRNAAYAAGATVVKDPLNEPIKHSNHFHIQW